MGLLDRFKKYINGDDYDEDEDLEYYEDENEEDNVIIKMENNSLGNEEIYEEYNFNKEESYSEVVEISEEEKIEKVKTAIYNAIKHYEDFEVLETKCVEEAKYLGIDYINYFKIYINNELQITRELKSIFKDDDHWNSAVVNTVLLMIWAYRGNSVETFKSIYNENKNLRLKIINLLVKLGNDVMEVGDEIVDFISEDLLKYDDERALLILSKLSKIKQNPKAVAVIQYFYKEYLKIGEATKAYRSLVSLVNCAEKYTAGHLRFLKSLALGNKTINLEKITSINYNEEKYVTLKDLNDNLKLEATITYYNLYKEDDDINKILNYLREYSLDLELRDRINLMFNN